MATDHHIQWQQIIDASALAAPPLLSTVLESLPEHEADVERLVEQLPETPEEVEELSGNVAGLQATRRNRSAIHRLISSIRQEDWAGLGRDVQLTAAAAILFYVRRSAPPDPAATSGLAIIAIWLTIWAALRDK